MPLSLNRHLHGAFLHSGGPYIALSHQHTIFAIKEIRKAAVEKHEVLAPWMCSVRATILRHDTPMELRQVVSGGDQNRQASVAPVKVSRVLELYLEEMAHSPNMSLVDAVKAAIEKSGYRRPGTTKALTSDWAATTSPWTQCAPWKTTGWWPPWAACAPCAPC